MFGLPQGTRPLRLRTSSFRGATFLVYTHPAGVDVLNLLGVTPSATMTLTPTVTPITPTMRTLPAVQRSQPDTSASVPFPTDQRLQGLRMGGNILRFLMSGPTGVTEFDGERFWAANGDGTLNGFLPTPPPDQARANLRGNLTEVRVGDQFRLDVPFDNLGQNGFVDVLVGTSLPVSGPASIAALGRAVGAGSAPTHLFPCPSNDVTLALFADSFTRIVTTCLTEPATFPFVAQTVPVPAGVSPVTLPLLNFTWPAGLPAGPYAFFFALVVPGALGDGTIDPGDIITGGVFTVSHRR
jgi:hypothetical protein